MKKLLPLFLFLFSLGLNAQTPCERNVNLQSFENDIYQTNGQQQFQAIEKIKATNTIEGSLSKVGLTAGNSISLETGFEVKGGATFKAEINNCPEVIISGTVAVPINVLRNQIKVTNLQQSSDVDANDNFQLSASNLVYAINKNSKKIIYISAPTLAQSSVSGNSIEKGGGQPKALNSTNVSLNAQETAFYLAARILPSAYSSFYSAEKIKGAVLALPEVQTLAQKIQESINLNGHIDFIAIDTFIVSATTAVKNGLDFSSVVAVPPSTISAPLSTYDAECYLHLKPLTSNGLGAFLVMDNDKSKVYSNGTATVSLKAYTDIPLIYGLVKGKIENGYFNQTSDRVYPIKPLSVSGFFDKLPISSLTSFKDYLRDTKILFETGFQGEVTWDKQETEISNLYLGTDENAFALMSPLSSNRMILYNIVLLNLHKVNIGIEFSEIDNNAVEAILDELLSVENLIDYVDLIETAKQTKDWKPVIKSVGLNIYDILKEWLTSSVKDGIKAAFLTKYLTLGDIIDEMPVLFGVSIGQANSVLDLAQAYLNWAVVGLNRDKASMFWEIQKRQSELDCGLLAYYLFNNNANDESENNFDGTPNNVVSSADRFGAVNKAYRFNGSNSFIEVDGWNQLTENSERSFVFWFKAEEKTGAVLSYGDFDTNKLIEVSFLDNGTQFGLNIFGDVVKFDSEKLILNKWYQLAFTFDNNRILKIFVDGRNVATKKLNLQTADANRFYIGKSLLNTRYFKGSIDEIRIFDREFSELEINELYKQEAPPAPDLTSGLVAHYKFEDNFLDETSNNNDGTQSGGVTFENGRNGAGKAAKFDGVDDRIRVANSTSIKNFNQQTISVWVKANSASGCCIPLLEKSVTSNQPEYYLGIEPPPLNKIYNSLNSKYNSANISAFNFGQWYNVLVSNNGNTTNFYLNGTKFNATSSSNVNFNNLEDLIIGNNPAGINEVLNGLLDDIRIYNRALTDEEVLQLYNQEKPTETIDLASGLVAYYPFNGNADDASGNGNNGTVNGASLTTDRYGNSGKAYSFDGVDDYINVNQTPSLDTKNEITISSWIYFQDNSDTGPIWNYNISNFTGLHFWVTSNSLQRELFVRFQTRNSTTVNGQSLQNQCLTSQSWNFVTMSYNKTSGVGKIYQNGTLISSLNLGVIELATGFSSRIGSVNFDNRKFKGKIDDIRIYNRALSDAEVTALYNQEKP